LFSKLEIFFVGLSRPTSSSGITINVNNITNSTYTHLYNNANTTWTYASSTVGLVNGFTAGGPYGVVHLTIPFYADSSNGKHWHSTGPSSAGSGVAPYYGTNSQCGAINRIDFGLSNVSAGTYYIYGVN
jgi:hypothetical protein